MAFKTSYLHNFITKLCRQQAAVSINYDSVNVNIRNTGTGEAQHRKNERLKLGGGQAYGRSHI
jgi:hypothetical protein